MVNIIDRILSEVCLDERIPDGIFDMSNNTHMEVLRETLTDTYNISLNDVVDIHNKMLEGKYPERQAYNKDGLLVTFPTPRHKQRAIQRGTHFEQNPVKGQQNVFGGGQQPPGSQPPPAPAPTSTPAPATPSTPASTPAPAGSQLPPSDQPPAAPPAPTAQSPSALPTSDQTASSDKQTLAVEPTATSASPAPPPSFDTSKSPQQRAAEAQAVKQIMKGDDTNPTLLPSIDENDLFELNESYNFARRMGYQVAMKVILEAIRRR